MADNQVKFVRKGGRVIPIRIAKGAAKVAKRAAPLARGVALAGAAYGIEKGIKQRKANPKQDIKVNRGLDALGLGLSVASGAVGAATFSHGAKGLIGGMIAGHAMDIGGIASNIASVAGKGKLKERAKQAARQEARNLIVGNAVYAAGILGVKRNREQAVKYGVAAAEKTAEYAQKIVAFARKALVRV